MFCGQDIYRLNNYTQSFILQFQSFIKIYHLSIIRYCNVLTEDLMIYHFEDKPYFDILYVMSNPN